MNAFEYDMVRVLFLFFGLRGVSCLPVVLPTCHTCALPGTTGGCRGNQRPRTHPCRHSLRGNESGRRRRRRRRRRRSAARPFERRLQCVLSSLVFCDVFVRNIDRRGGGAEHVVADIDEFCLTDIPEFPVERPAMKAMAAGPAGAVAGAAAHSRPAYVPSFMPAFPEAYTYKYTGAYGPCAGCSMLGCCRVVVS